ncbi:hypothetical protein ACB092_05G000100 [Castanea dentata]
MATPDNSIRKLADSVQVLADTVNSANPHLKVSDVAQCCRLHYSFLFFFAAAIGFTDLELQMKVDNFLEASKKYDTIQAIVETEIINGYAMNNNSHCRNLVRSKRVLNLLREVMEQILARRGKSLAETFAIAYDQVFASYHGWTSSDGFILSIGLSKNAIIAALEELPSRDLLLKLLSEDGKHSMLYCLFLTSGILIVYGQGQRHM